MRQSLLSRMAKRAVRQGQVGQTIVIMAFGFIVLLAFVGIVTDVSLMFVRYTTLRRAVDAAAVAAAGQVRRTVATPEELTRAGNNKVLANGFAFARNIANINLAARQFIEFYGLSPSNVVVDSCDTINPADNVALANLLQCGDAFQPRKLVQVTAQLPSPTVFLRLIGWGTVTLEASAISETAVLDVVLIFDAAESMLKQTTYNEWKKVPKVNPTTQELIYKADGSLDTEDKSARYLPPRVNFAPNWNGNKAIFSLWPASGGNSTNAYVGSYPLAWKLLLTRTQNQIFDDTTNFPQIAFTWDGTNANQIPLTDSKVVREDCRVRFFPYAEVTNVRAMRWLVTPTSPVADDLRNSYTALLRNRTSPLTDSVTGNPVNTKVLGPTETYPAIFDGFLPAYDFYGCCNDPNGDMNFNDLVCQPFQKVREATERFLDRVDFVRGDRVAFVTFDQTAFLIDPDGAPGPQLPMITSQENAVAALRKIVGVRAEPNYYADTNEDGAWDAFVKGGTPYTGLAGGGIPVTYEDTYNFSTGAWDNVTTAPNDAGLNNTTLGELNYYGVRYDCIFNNATIPYPLSLYSSPASSANHALYSASGQLSYPLDYPATSVIESRWPTPLASMNGPVIMNPNLNDPLWDDSMRLGNSNYTTKRLSRQVDKALYSYEFRAACGGNNVGAALRVGSNALLDPRTVRIGNTGAVWVMVLLGDGAAAASDPVQRGSGSIAVANPYGDPAQAPTAGSYGGLGLCPYGTPGDQMGLTSGWTTRPPRCSDDGSETSNGGIRGYRGPVSRHTCTGAAVGDNSNATIDLNKTGCQDKYDVDDYARDWADFIGLTELPDISPFKGLAGAETSRSLLQLPTIFTIGFGLDFPETGGCAGVPSDNASFTNINDCLGEELLRYIADVGDNNRIDTDYQQDYLADGLINGETPDGHHKYGERGACEAPIPGPSGSYTNADAAASAGEFNVNYDKLKFNPFAYGKSCGNYYNAPNGAALTKVFEDIASRMFTRITK